MTAPFPEPAHRRVRDAAVLAGAFGVGLVIGAGYVAYATASELVDRFDRVWRR